MLTDRKDRGNPNRVVFEESQTDSGFYFTTFDLGTLGSYGRKLTPKGEELYERLLSIEGVNSGELSVQLHKNSVYISKKHAAKWDEITPQVIEVLKEKYGLQKIEVES